MAQSFDSSYKLSKAVVNEARVVERVSIGSNEGGRLSSLDSIRYRIVLKTSP